MKDTENIDIEATSEFGLRDIDGGLILVASAGVVDQDVELAELLEGTLDGTVPVAALSDVHLLHDDRASIELRGELLRWTCVDIANEDPGAFSYEEG